MNAKPFSDQLRAAVLRSPKTRYALSQETGIAQSTLCRFVHGGGGLGLESIDKLWAALGLTLNAPPKAQTSQNTKRATRKDK